MGGGEPLPEGAVGGQEIDVTDNSTEEEKGSKKKKGKQEKTRL